MAFLGFRRLGPTATSGGREERLAQGGRELYVPRLPAAGAHADLWAVAALERWLAVAAADGAFLRRRAVAAGVSGDFAGHLPRRGFITNAAKKKIPIA